MAGRIAGITIEIGGDTKNLQKALKGVDSQLKTTQSNLKDINKLLKLDPKNTELLAQKQRNLQSAISLTKDRIEQLKEAQKGVQEGSAEWEALNREIIANEQQLKSLQKEYRQFGSVAAQQIKAVGKQLQETGAKVEEFGKKFSGISGAAAAIGGGLLKLGYDAVQSADDLNTLSKQTGFTTEEIQKMQYASDLIDVSFEDIAGALKKFKSKIDPANEALASLGVNTTNADGSLRSATAVFNDTVKALSGVANETERDQLAMDLFGKSADSLAGIIDDGGAALEAFGQQAEDLGLILDQDTLDSLNETNDTLDELKKNISGTMARIGASVGSVLAPLLEKGADLIGQITEKLRELTPEQTETILKIVGIVAAVAPAIIIIGKLISGLGSIITVIGTVVGVLGGPLTIAIAAAVAVGILLWKNWDKIKAKAQEVATNVVSAWEGLKAGVAASVTAVSSWVTTTWENIKTTVTTTVENLKTAVVTVWEGLKSSISSVVDGIKGKIETLKASLESLKAKAQNVVDRIKSIFSGEIKFPHIKLPHFRVSGGVAPYGLGGKGSMPSINIDWYRKAYDNPVLFTSPTVLPTANGYKGFGDGTGAEIVMGLDKLRELVGNMGNNVVVQVVLEGDARQMFKAVQKTNMVRTRATNYNALAAGV